MLAASSTLRHQISSFTPSLTVETNARRSFIATKSSSSSSAASPSSSEASSSEPEVARLYEVPEFLVLGGLGRGMLQNVQACVRDIFEFYTKHLPDGLPRRTSDWSTKSGRLAKQASSQAATARTYDAQTLRALQTLNRMVRGGLCTSLARYMHHGFRETSYFIRKNHLWDLILEATRSNDSGGGGLDADPALAYHNSIVAEAVVQQLEENHRLPTKSVRFRSFICFGLNERCLHEWFRLLTTNQAALNEYYDRDDEPLMLNQTLSGELVSVLQSLQFFTFDLDLEYEWKV